METICVMPSRRIEAGSPGRAWDLAHDHTKGGTHDYLGPAHKECNQAEALGRGVSWEGAPSLRDLLASVGYDGDYPTAEGDDDGYVVGTFTDGRGGIWEVAMEVGPRPGELVRTENFLGGPDDHPLNVHRRKWVIGEVRFPYPGSSYLG
ncbi:hypothetical protein GCM10009583_10640 [Ornithinicoccus hortensis]